MTGILAAVVLELMRESLTGTHCRYRLADGEYVTQPCEAAAPVVDSNARPRLRRVIRDHVAYDYDGTTLVRTIPLWYNAKPARVFDPNPVVATNDPTLHDRNDAASAVPESAYRAIEIEDSPYVTLVDRQSPFVAPAELGMFDREQDGFEDVSAVFHIDRTQRYLQSLGYVGARQIVAYAVETDTHAAGGTDNSFFLPSNTQAGRGTLFFGTGGTDDAEDGDLVVHEYAHAVHEWIAPGTFLGTFASQSRAISEGFGDYWAFSSHQAQRLASGRDRYCFADWDARCAGDAASEQCGYPEGADCLRRLDTGRTMADYDRGDSAGTEHRNSAIWSGALIALFDAIGKRTTDILIIESLFGAPSNPTFATMAQRMVSVDRQLFGGAHVNAICAAMSARGIDCGFTPRGELTFFQSTERTLAIPENNTDGVSSRITITDSRAIERVLVRVDVAHPSRGDLRITLTAPDGTRVILQQVSFDRTRDLHVTFGLDASSFESLDAFRGRGAGGTWTLNVADLRALDAGTLESWGLHIQFAGDVPRSERPAVAANAQVLPIVAHAPGANGAFYRTDVFLQSDVTRTATLIFTPSGEDGRTSFAAANVVVPANEVVALRDVLPSLFARSGTGSLVIDGGVRVSARMHTGGLGHTIEPVQGVTGTLRVGALPASGRLNAGITETAGETRVIDVRIDGSVLRQVVPPYSHVQFAVPAGAGTIEFPAGTAIAAYVTAGDETSNDALYLAAGVAGTGVAPAIRAPGASGTAWETGLAGNGGVSFIDRSGTQLTVLASGVHEDALASLFGLELALGVVRVTPSMRAILRGREHTSALVPRTGAGVLFPIEHSSARRTNLTLIGDTETTARVTVLDAAGNVLESFERRLQRNQLIQVPLLVPVVDGQVVVDGEGLHAWVSVIDNASADSTITGSR
jgi:zinc metalloprotease ZmpB